MLTVERGARVEAPADSQGTNRQSMRQSRRQPSAEASADSRTVEAPADSPVEASIDSRSKLTVACKQANAGCSAAFFLESFHFPKCCAGGKSGVYVGKIGNLALAVLID